MSGQPLNVGEATYIDKMVEISPALELLFLLL